jgi:hypothetical protein
MTLSAVPIKYRYEGNGTTSTFAYSNIVFTEDDLVVEIITRATDALVETLTITTDYTVTILSNGTGSVTVVSGKIPTSLQDIQIRRSLSLEQDTVLPTGTKSATAIIETALDRVVGICQEISEVTDRSVKFPITSIVTDTVLPTPEDDKVLTYDGTEGAFKLSTLTLTELESVTTESAASATAAAASATAAAASATDAAASATDAAASATDAAASAATFDAPSVTQTQNNTFCYLGTTGGTSSAYTLTPTRAIESLVTGQQFSFKAGLQNTLASGNTTLAISGLTATNLKKIDTAGAKQSLVAGDVKANITYGFRYDGTDFMLTDHAPIAVPVASTITSGIVELATDAEAQAGTDTAKAVTPDNLGATVIGIGQTWANYTGTRLGNTVYQNTTGRPIQVCVAFGGSGKIFEVSVDNSTWITIMGGSSDRNISVSAIIPNNWYYRCTDTGPAVWAELR